MKLKMSRRAFRNQETPVHGVLINQFIIATMASSKVLDTLEWFSAVRIVQVQTT